MTSRIVSIRTANKWKSHPEQSQTVLAEEFSKINVQEQPQLPANKTSPTNEHEIDEDDEDNELLSTAPSDYDEANRLYHIQFVKRCTANGRREPEKKFKNGTRMSMHFSNDRMREIERCNQILLKKILNQGPSHCQVSSARAGQTKSTASTQPASRVTSATINRRKQQLQIDRDNELLLKKLQNIHKHK